MQTVCLFAADYDSPKALHEALKVLLSLPGYYGLNADALNDCLSEQAVCPSLWVRREGDPEVCSALDRVVRVFRANGGTVKEL